MKNKAFMVSCVVTFFVVSFPTRSLTLVFFLELGAISELLNDH